MHLIRMKYFICLPLLIGLTLSGCKKDGKGEPVSFNTFEALSENFASPPVEYKPVPFLIWNGKITRPAIDTSLVYLKNTGFGGIMVHARHSLITEYLSDEWFDMWNYTLQKAKESRAPMWIYDEDYAPSGFAGGLVPDQMPESFNEGTGMIMEKTDRLVIDTAQTCLAVLKKVNDDFVNILPDIKDEAGKPGDYYVFYKYFDEPSAFTAEHPYVDLLHKGVAEKFIDITMRQGYEKHFKQDFGGIIKGSFTDEPSLLLTSRPGLLKWNPALFETFEKRRGYDLEEKLVSLYVRVGDWRKVRHDYYLTLLDLFIDNWAKPWYEYTHENKLIWTGHYWDHTWPDATQGSDCMALYPYHTMPGVDLLFNQMDRPRPEQYGNVRIAREASGVANQMGYNRVLAESFGAAGWDVRFEDLKRLGDWQYAMGINFMVTHMVYTTFNGVRKSDFPPSYSYHNSWAMQFRHMNEYFARLSLALSAGEQVNNILVIEPTTTAWMYNTAFRTGEKPSLFASPELDSIDRSFRDFLDKLEQEQIEYDLGSESIMAEYGKVNGPLLEINKRSYRLVVLPPWLENLDPPTVKLIEEFLHKGGKVLSFCGIPSFMGGSPSQELRSVTDAYQNQWLNFSDRNDPAALQMLHKPGYNFSMTDTGHTQILHYRRILSDGDILFYINPGFAGEAKGKVSLAGKSIVELDAADGSIWNYPAETSGGMLTINIDLPPAGSLLLFVSKEKNLSYPDKKQFVSFTEVDPGKKPAVNPAGKNVLNIDYLDIRFGNSQINRAYFFAATDTLFRYYGFKDGNPWFWSVQFKQRTVDRDTFSTNTGFEATYHFDVDKACTELPLEAVVERPGLYSVAINGAAVKAIPGKWYLDRDFGVYDLTGHIKAGDNQLTLNASRMSVFAELQAAFIVGDFLLSPQSRGWKIIPSSPLETGSWKAQGMPFYAGAVSYGKEAMLTKGKTYFVQLEEWKGIVAEVKVNNISEGIIAWQPYRIDISDLVSDGANKIEVLVYGSMKNLIGPFHTLPPRRGIMTQFEYKYPTQTSMPAGTDYDILDYGLMNDFKILEAKAD